MDEFVSIPDFQDYFINRQGVVLSKRRYKDGIILKQTLSNRGYYIVTFSINKKRTNFPIHRGLAKTFIPNPNNYDCVDHINRNRQDNRLENLRWCSYTENNKNRSISKTNNSGYKQISWYKKQQRWCVRIHRNGKYLSRKCFKKLEDAVEFRNKILTELGEEII
jgi:hypothetical protein